MSQTTQTAKKRIYEAVILMHPDSTVEEHKELFQKNKGIIEGLGKGNVVAVETWGRRNLANAIGKVHKAYYFHTYFEADPQVVLELERTMGINDKVLRYMHTKLDERIPVAKHIETYRKGIQESANKEREREAKIQARKAAANAASSH